MLYLGLDDCDYVFSEGMPTGSVEPMWIHSRKIIEGHIAMP